jgi:hypothetical protein
MYYLEIFGKIYKFKYDDIDNLYNKLSYEIMIDYYNIHSDNLLKNFKNFENFEQKMINNYDFFLQDNDIKNFLKDYNINYFYKITDINNLIININFLINIPAV